MLCKLAGNWYFVELYFLGCIVGFSYTAIQSPICMFYLNFMSCSILALLLTAVTCFLNRICKCWRSRLLIQLLIGLFVYLKILNISSSFALSWFLIQIRSSLNISKWWKIYGCIYQVDLCKKANHFYDFECCLLMIYELLMMCYLFCIYVA